MNTSEQRTLKKIIYIAFVFHLLYLLSIVILNVMKTPFHLIFVQDKHYLPSVNGFALSAAVCSTILFVLIGFILLRRIQKNKENSIGWSLLMILFSFADYFLFPGIANLLARHAIDNGYMKHLFTESDYSSRLVQMNMQDMMKPLLFAAVVLLLCSFSMNWYRRKYETRYEH